VNGLLAIEKQLSGWQESEGPERHLARPIHGTIGHHVFGSIPTA